AEIEDCCAQALVAGLFCVWIGTCCFDKSSSAVVSEAINSILRYYRNSCICCAYLQVVSTTDQDPRIPGSEFTRSEWFKRGWESQELIAPKFVFFYSKHWVELGTKKNLAETVLEITKVNMATL
ncbi:hypothetical protein B0J12DRAFT_540212, partial [Macrophomina phaseolina]